MLEINKWFFVQLANFLLLFIILNIILFKPILRIFKEREESTTGSLDEAKEMDKEKDDLIAQIDTKISHARIQAREIFEGLADEGLSAQKITIESAQNEAIDINKKAKEDLQAATENAKNSMKTKIEAFSKQIVEKLAKT